MTVRAAHARLRELLPERVELVPAGGLVEELRAVKEPGELARIRAAAELADDGLRELRSSAAWPGAPSARWRSTSSTRCARLGAEAPELPSIVALGRARRAAARRARATSRSRADTLVTSTWGRALDGYCSDCTRTFATGELPRRRSPRSTSSCSRRRRRRWRRSRRGRRAGRSTRWRATSIDAAGHGEHFGHGLGHGVGLEVHEAPRLAQHGRRPRWSPGTS